MQHENDWNRKESRSCNSPVKVQSSTRLWKYLKIDMHKHSSSNLSELNNDMKEYARFPQLLKGLEVTQKTGTLQVTAAKIVLIDNKSSFDSFLFHMTVHGTHERFNQNKRSHILHNTPVLNYSLQCRVRHTGAIMFSSECIM